MKWNERIGIRYVGGIEIVEGRKMNVEVVLMGVECEGVLIGERFWDEVCWGNKCGNVVGGVVKWGRRS